MLMRSLRIVRRTGCSSALQHGEIAIDDGYLVAARESRPGVDAHFLANGKTMHRRRCAR